MRTTKIFLMAALALTFAACSNDDNEIVAPEQPAEAEGIPFTATISIGESAATRALEESGGDLVASWAVGEKVALIHNGVNDEMEVVSVSGGLAIISGTLRVTPSDGDDVTVIYPSSAAADDATGNVKPDLLYAQNGGTLADVAANYEVRKGTGTLSVDGGTATLDGDVSLDNQFSIFKFTLTDGSDPIAATSFTFIYGEQDYVVTPGSPKSELYVALPDLTASTYFFIAEAGSDSYIAKATVSAATSAGKYYQVPVSMTKRKEVNLRWSDDYTAQNGDILTDNCYPSAKISIADGAIVTLKDLNINYDAGETPALTLLGDATIILENENIVKCYGEDAPGPREPGIYVPAGKTLTIGGTGSLTAKGRTGIGAYDEHTCGNIIICGGTIIATGYDGAGIGGCYGGNCGNITISGGTVTATADKFDDDSTSSHAAGIGSGSGASCGYITITAGVTSVTATKQGEAPNSIGAGNGGSCAGVTIGGVEGAITKSPYTYKP